MARIILLGFMGTGKSTLGVMLSKKLKIPFFDSDSEIEKKEKLSVQTIFERHGEDYFREKEREFIEQIKSEQDFVLAVGGGLPCFNNLMKELNDLGTTIYLKASPKFIYSRLKTKKNERPLIKELTDEELLEFIENKLFEREIIYLQANLTVDSKDLNVDKLINLLHLHQKS